MRLSNKHFTSVKCYCKTFFTHDSGLYILRHDLPDFTNVEMFFSHPKGFLPLPSLIFQMIILHLLSTTGD